MEHPFDLIVLGAGSGGLAAAKRAARSGARVAIVEGDRVGGTCVIRGCVPKKLLVYGSLYGEYLQDSSSFGVKIVLSANCPSANVPTTPANANRGVGSSITVKLASKIPQIKPR